MSSTLLKAIRWLAAIGGLALVLTGECQAVFIAAFATFFMIGIWIHRLPHVAKILGMAQPVLALLVLGVAIADFLYLSNSFLLTVAHFLLALQGLRMLALRTNRECLGSLLISSMMVLSASTLAVDWTYFAVLLLFLVSVVWTLMMLTLLQESASAGLPLKEGTPLWLETAPVLRAAAAAAFTIAMVCCAIVFVIFPRFNFQGFRGQFLQPVHKTGYTSQVDLGGGKISSDDSIVMRVEIKPVEQSLWTGYLRGRALEVFNGRSWRKYAAPVDRVYTRGATGIRLPLEGGHTGEILHQSIYLESMDSPILFSAARPVSFQIERPFLEVFNDGGVQRGNGDSWRVHYEVESALSQLDPAVTELGQASLRRTSAKLATSNARIPKRLRRLVESGDGRRSEKEVLLSVPVSDRVGVLAASVVRNAKDQLGQAQAIANYLRNSFGYTLDARNRKKGESPVETFLFESKKGHCEYFAAAMCVMLRTRGIPARLVTGFLSNEWNRQGNYVMVRGKHAHAWVEAYIEPYGWLGFDPSPRNAADDFGTNLIRRWSETMDYMNLRWNRYILSYDSERQVSFLKDFLQQSNQISVRFGSIAGTTQRIVDWVRGRSLSFGSEEKTSNTALAVPRTVGVLLVSGGIILGLFFAFRSRQRRHPVWFYRPFLRRLQKRLGKKADSQTLREYVESSAGKLGSHASDAAFLQQTYYRLRFNPAARLNKDEFSEIQAVLKRLF